MILLHKTLFSSIAMLLLILMVRGCGSEVKGPTRYHVSGTVTFDGKPVPFGYVRFTPDDTQGNGGPQGIATIRDGKYDTAKEGKATIGGPHKVQIYGISKEAEHAGEDDPALLLPPLFPGYTTDIDLPKENTTHDFVVPVSKK
ncbi:hypothetical protein MNBD_PLANCTO02-1497 [hydrothermal vent metagenome]|uniref:Carboxypeptidase regulatory-like domain-containing protein n=1 Tax=hydrothermal vent metagenome TaxID=652676 RepID=A0A3B1E760_9ZZZZ